MFSSTMTRSRPRALPLGLALLAWSACQRSPSLDELNANRPVADPAVDATPAGAPYQPGQRRSVGDASAVFSQPDAPAYFNGVVMPGDLDGDGLGDLVAWGWLGNPPNTVPCDHGCPGFDQLMVHVIYGAPSLGTAGAAVVASARIEGWHVNGGRYGVAAAGDVDGDGHPDLLVSVGQLGCQQGSVYLIRGGGRLVGHHDVRDLGTLLRESGVCSLFGAAAGVGDLDGDGRAEIAITAPGTDPGAAYLYYGSAAASPVRRSERDADASFTAPGARLAVASAAGDVDGDGHPDLLLAAARESGGEGPVWLVRSGGARFHGPRALDDPSLDVTRLQAASVHAVGDLDGDGRAELAAMVATGSRDAFLIAGRVQWPPALEVRSQPTFVTLGADLAPGEAGSAIAAGDVDGDGRPDFVYGEPGHRHDSQPAGAAHLFRGPVAPAGAPLTLDAATTFLGQTFVSQLDARQVGFDHLGAAMAGGSDLDGDHLDDLAFVGTVAPPGGRVYLWMGRRAR